MYGQLIASNMKQRYLCLIPIVLSILNGTTCARNFAVGFNFGYGSADWSGLTASDPSSRTSTPISVHDKGIAFGVNASWTLNQYVGFIGRFMHFPQAKLVFSKDNILTPLGDDGSTYYTNTNAVTFALDFSIPIAQTNFRWVNEIGLLYVLRSDKMHADPDSLTPLANLHYQTVSNLGADFGAGVDYYYTKNFVINAMFLYGTGYGESEVLPENDYVPFTYSITLGISYLI